MKLTIALLVACQLLAAGVGWASSVSYEATIGPQAASWAQSAVFPKFNPASGTLTSVKVEVTAWVDASASLESLDAEPQQAQVSASADTSVVGPDGSVLVAASPSAAKTAALAAFDGANDFSGASASVLALASSQNAAAELSSGISHFVGPDEIALSVVSDGKSSVSGSGNIGSQLSGNSAAKVVITYNYQP